MSFGVLTAYGFGASGGGSAPPSSGGGYAGSVIVGVSPDAPAAGANTWSPDGSGSVPSFENGNLVLFINGIVCDLVDAGNGNMWVNKPFNSGAATVENYQFFDNDVITYIFLKP